MAQPLIIFGSPASQPSRTVYWSCLLGGLPFHLGVREDVGVHDANPRLQVPWIKDGNFILTEMAAIACYLAERHAWQQLYPAEEQTRARINQFLHMHHTLVRGATRRLMAPHVVKPLRKYSFTPLNEVLIADSIKAAWEASDPLVAGGKAVHTITEFLEENYFSNEVPFVCKTETASLADLVCYAELGQLTFANLFDFSGYPRTERWLRAMTHVPFHDAVHAFNIKLGDIATIPNSFERMAPALDAGVKALQATGLVTNLSVTFRDMVLTAD